MAGGAIFTAEGDDGAPLDFIVQTCTFNNNSATRGAGGALAQQGESDILRVQVDTPTTFNNNSATCCFAREEPSVLGGSFVDISIGFGSSR